MILDQDKRLPDYATIASAGAWLTIECHSAALRGGWHTDLLTGQPHSAKEQHDKIPLRLCLIHSEISEALEGARKNRADDHLPARSNFEVELADATIRIFDLAGSLGINLGDVIAEKMAYNAKRADHTPDARRGAGGKAF